MGGVWVLDAAPGRWPGVREPRAVLHRLCQEPDELSPSRCRLQAGMALAGASSPQCPRGLLCLWHLRTAASTRLIYLWGSSCTSNRLLPLPQRQQQLPALIPHPWEAEDGELLFSKSHRQLPDHKTPKGMFRPVCFQFFKKLF